MERKEQKSPGPFPGELSEKQRDLNEAAHREADRDISTDADLSAHSPNDDLDEGESARLGEGKNELI